jgi:hypothetical protein
MGGASGAVGGRIVAEVLLGLLAGDQHTYLSEQPGFTPAHFLAPNGVFGMPELLRSRSDKRRPHLLGVR